MSVPVIYITGNGNAAVRTAALQSGCLAYLTKPFSAKSLMKPLHRAAGVCIALRPIRRQVWCDARSCCRRAILAHTLCWLLSSTRFIVILAPGIGSSARRSRLRTAVAFGDRAICWVRFDDHLGQALSPGTFRSLAPLPCMKIRSHSESHLVELDDGSMWQIFPGDLDVTLNWLPDTELKLVRIEDPASSHALISEDNSSVRVLPVGDKWPLSEVHQVLKNS